MACHLVVASLDAAPPFTALSYQWGDASQWHTRPILVDNKKILYISENLWSAPRRRQSDTQVEVIWADQLCINQAQTDAAIAERNRQIPLMADIYASARFVMAWLGPEEEEEGVAGKDRDGLEFLAKADRLFNIHCADIADIECFPLSCFLEMGKQPVVDGHPAPGWTRTVVSGGTSGQAELTAAQRTAMALWRHYALDMIGHVEAAKKLLRSSYWNRAWTFQEMFASDHVVFYRGALGSLHMSRIRGALVVLEQVDGIINRFESSFIRMTSVFSCDSEFGWGLGSAFGTIGFGSPVEKCITTWLTKRTGGPWLSLGTLVPYGSEASDPRDHIYALLGMASDREQLRIIPDYNKSVAEVFTEFVLSYVKKGDLNLLSCNKLEKKHPDLPSWVPDWTPGSWAPGLFVREYWSKGRLPFVAGRSGSLGFELLSDPVSSGILSLRGVRLGEITDVSDEHETVYLGLGPHGPRSGMPHFHMGEKGGPGQRGARILSRFIDLLSRSPSYAAYDFDGPLPGEVQEEVVYKGLEVCCAYRGSHEAFPNFLVTNFGEEKARKSGFCLGFLVAEERGWEVTPSDAFDSDRVEELRSAARETAGIVATELIREYDHLGKQFYASTDGRFGSGPGDIRVGDVVVIFVGSPVPHVLRPMAGDSTKFQLVGWAYHAGVMVGEVFQQENIASRLEVMNID